MAVDPSMAFYSNLTNLNYQIEKVKNKALSLTKDQILMDQYNTTMWLKYPLHTVRPWHLILCHKHLIWYTMWRLYLSRKHAWQEQVHVAVAKGDVDSPCCGVKAGDAQCHRLFPPTVIIGTFPYVVWSKDIVWNYWTEQNT